SAHESEAQENRRMEVRIGRSVSIVPGHEDALAVPREAGERCRCVRPGHHEDTSGRVPVRSGSVEFLERSLHAAGSVSFGLETHAGSCERALAREPYDAIALFASAPRTGRVAGDLQHAGRVTQRCADELDDGILEVEAAARALL